MDDASNASLLHAAVLLFILGATLSTVYAMHTADRALAHLDDDALALHNPWGTP